MLYKAGKIFSRQKAKRAKNAPGGHLFQGFSSSGDASNIMVRRVPFSSHRPKVGVPLFRLLPPEQEIRGSRYVNLHHGQKFNNKIRNKKYFDCYKHIERWKYDECAILKVWSNYSFLGFHVIQGAPCLLPDGPKVVVLLASHRPEVLLLWRSQLNPSPDLNYSDPKQHKIWSESS